MKTFDCTADEIRSQIDKIKCSMLDKIKGGYPVIFGAGICGHKIYDLLHGYGVHVLCFCDNMLGGNTDQATGLRIIGTEELRESIDNPKILVCVGAGNACEAICEQLLLLGFEKTQIHRMNEYFDEKVILADDEMFIDCGGFDGDSAMRFIERCHGHYRGIVIFEPEFCKKAEIEKKLGKNHYELRQLGVWSKKEKLYFDAVGTCSSHISEKEGDYVIETAALDEIIFDRRPTYIKMDIEGAEQEALKGCRKIIQTYKPKLAICIYHKPEDLYEIPIMIKEINPEYKLYVRQYANAWFDTVLYAV